uniref:GBF-interacting protein 1 N-terminal domain-containing protein n=1 Tax=Opuntia streptacantha TaxID=393608 RepID=A0A7C8YFQ8_OPUST
MSNSGGSRVSIPNSVRKTIQDIKEITGNHSEEDIYAMLKDCSMDPNETTQRLLHLDTLHEVKRKRDKRKEVFTPHPYHTYNVVCMSQVMIIEPYEVCFNLLCGYWLKL